MQAGFSCSWGKKTAYRLRQLLATDILKQKFFDNHITWNTLPTIQIQSEQNK